MSSRLSAPQAILALGLLLSQSSPAWCLSSEGGGASAAKTAADAAPRFQIEVAAHDGSFKSKGTVEENKLFIVSDESGNGLGFRPSLATGAGSTDKHLIDLKVVTVKNAGKASQTEDFLLELKLKEGSSGCVDPGDDEGSFSVTVHSVPPPGPPK
jgi:hypothetical protein